MNKVRIPGSTTTAFGRIWADTTKEALEAHLRTVTGAQAANKRSNPVYVAEVRRLRAAIAAR